MFRSDRLANAAVRLSCIVMAMDKGLVNRRSKSATKLPAERF